MAAPPKRAGMRSCRCVWTGAAETRIARTVEASSRRIEAVPIHDRPAVRDVSVVVVVHSATVVPIVSPVVPAPAEAAKKSNPKAEPKSDSGAVQEKSGIRIPTGEHGQRIPVHQPRIVFGYINHVCRCRFNDDRLSLGFYFLLGRGTQVAGLLSLLPHNLNRLSQVLLLVQMGVAKFRCPGKVLAHIREYRGELRQGFDTGIPRLCIDLLR